VSRKLPAKSNMIVTDGANLEILDNASNFSNGQASASFTSTSLTPQLKNETAMFDEVSWKVWQRLDDIALIISRYTFAGRVSVGISFHLLTSIS
jgi:hypothetical protein